MGLQDYWNEQGEVLAKRFRSIRRAHSDSDVKGGRNEASLALLLAENVHPRRVLTNTELIDSHGVHSDEIDIAICNEWQPFASDSLHLLIAEGVDCAIQVKARIDSREMERVFKNAASAKALRRKHFQGEQVQASMHDVPHFVDRIPYICVAFESALSIDSLCAKIDELAQGSPAEMQPDAIVVVGKCVAMNVRENGGALRVRPGNGSDPWKVVDADAGLTWSILLWIIYAVSTPVQRPKHPLMHYAFWPTEPEVPDDGQPQARP